MATIFEKTSSDKVLALEPREALVYPFAFDWSEIRIGIECFIINNTGDTTGINNNTFVEEIFTRTSDPKTLFYFGIKESGPNPDRQLPFQSGNNFLGYMLNPSNISANNQTRNGCLGASNSVMPTDIALIRGFNNSYTTIGRGDFLLCAFLDSGSNSTVSSGIYNNDPAVGAGFALNRSGVNSNVGYSNYVARNGLTIRINNKNQTGQNYSMSFYNNYSYAPNMTGLRSFLSSPSPWLTTTGFFTTGYGISGGPIPVPNSLFIYYPYFLNRICISNLLVEKYV